MTGARQIMWGAYVHVLAGVLAEWAAGNYKTGRKADNINAMDIWTSHRTKSKGRSARTFAVQAFAASQTLAGMTTAR
jgi:hypothetical protein